MVLVLVRPASNFFGIILVTLSIFINISSGINIF
jgi:hypothetical protein